MYGRTLFVIAASTLAFATAHAQTGTGSSTGTQGTTPGTTTTSPGSPSSGSTMGTGGGTTGTGPGTSVPNQAQSPGSFNASTYKTKTECLNAAQAARASNDACKDLK